MKFTTVSALLALAAAASASAIPAEKQVQKRAVCTTFGYTYACVKPATTTTKAAPTTTTKATSPATTAASPTNTAGSGTSGASGYTSGSTASDIDNNSGCTDLTVIFARGTSEGGNIGTVIGQPMFKQLLSDLGASRVTLQGVNYPADSAGNANCGAAGGAAMASEVKTILARCPNTKIALSGYSQGACVVHNAVQSQGVSASSIAAVALFGDPFNGQSVGSIPASKVHEYCGSSDGICDAGGSDESGGHLDYGSDAAKAATFIENTAGVTK